MLRFIFNIVIAGLVSIPVLAQENKIPVSVSAGVEIGNYLYSRIVENVDFKEATADFRISRFLVVADYGSASLRQAEEFHNYFSEGNYWRVGVDYNFIKKKRNPNIIFLGVRYGQSSFSESVSYSTHNRIETFNAWPESTLQIDIDDVTGKWVELVSGIKVDVFKGIQLGFTGRYKFLASDDSDNSFSNYYLPGYGKRSQRNTRWGLSYYVGYRFRF